MIVIEMNPRVSRSSALASKATGFPIAKIAAKLAVGYTLDEIVNDITRETPAAFEPTLDYVVVKVPRFAFEKFPGADPVLTTHMKSVGEAMSIGRNFTEALGKALRSMETKAAGFWTVADDDDGASVAELLERAAVPTDGRLYAVERALRAGAERRRRQRRHRHRRLVHRPDRPDRRVGRGGARGLHAHRGAAAPGQAARAVRPAGGGPAARTGRRVRRAGAAAPARYPAGLQDRRHLRRRVRGAHAVPLLLLRRGERGRAAAREAEGAHPRQRSQPHRAGHRVRLLVRARGDGAAGGRLRDRHGQLQPRDRLHRLRHRRPPLLRAADLRGRPGGRARRARVRHGRRASSAPSAGRHRSAWPKPSRTPGCPCSAPSPRPSTWPSTAAPSAASWTRPACPRPGTAPPPRSRRPGRWPTRSATRCWCGRPTCWAGAAWRSSTTRTTCRTTSAAPPR